ncbi:hypothetical protein ACWC5I_33065 [Kitasatospora sp. NPDC001574]
MLPKTVREAVEAAAVLVEEVGKRVLGTAAGLLEKGGIDVTDVERRLNEQFPPSARSLQTLAGEAVTAGRAGVDLAVGVARGEVEKVFERVGDQVTKVGVVLAYLESKLREVEEDGGPRPAEPGPAPAPRAGGLFENGWEEEPPGAGVAAAADGSATSERIEVDEPVEVDPPVPPNGTAVAGPSAGGAAEKPAQGAAGKTAAGASAADRSTVEKPAVTRATGKKAAAKKAAAKKTAAGPVTAAGAGAGTGDADGKPAAKKAAAKKTPVKKTAVKKTATARKAPPREAKQPTGQEPPVKRTATRKTTVRRTTTTKKPDA